ncbi:hypothetical protein MYSI104531_21430 [Mycobacterium simiae]
MVERVFRDREADTPDAVGLLAARTADGWMRLTSNESAVHGGNCRSGQKFVTFLCDSPNSIAAI